MTETNPNAKLNAKCRKRKQTSNLSGNIDRFLFNSQTSSQSCAIYTSNISYQSFFVFVEGVGKAIANMIRAMTTPETAYIMGSPASMSAYALHPATNIITKAAFFTWKLTRNRIPAK